jgi:hypothetical protein
MLGLGEGISRARGRFTKTKDEDLCPDLCIGKAAAGKGHPYSHKSVSRVHWRGVIGGRIAMRVSVTEREDKGERGIIRKRVEEKRNNRRVDLPKYDRPQARGSCV